MNKTAFFSSTKQKSLVTRSFMVAGGSFLLICLVGIISWLIVDSAGLLKGINTNTRFDFGVYKASTRLVKLSAASGVLIMISMVMSIIFQMRFRTISKTFIYLNYAFYILAQGFGFGTLFAVWNALELLGIFALAGGAFTAMGLVGYYSKDLSHWGKLLFTYSMVVLLAWIGSFILIKTGVINAKASYSLFTLAFGILFLGYTAYDVWSLKKTAEWENSNGTLDADMSSRIVLFFGFRLLVDLIGIIWTLVRFWFLTSD